MEEEERIQESEENEKEINNTKEGEDDNWQAYLNKKKQAFLRLGLEVIQEENFSKPNGSLGYKKKEELLVD